MDKRSAQAPSNALVAQTVQPSTVGLMNASQARLCDSHPGLSVPHPEWIALTEAGEHVKSNGRSAGDLNGTRAFVWFPDLRLVVAPFTGVFDYLSTVNLNVSVKSGEARMLRQPGPTIKNAKRIVRLWFVPQLAVTILSDAEKVNAAIQAAQEVMGCGS